MISSVEINKCSQCRGLWFAEGKFLQAEEYEGIIENWKDFDLWSDQEVFKTEWSSRACPVCGKRMASVLYGHTDVKIDTCTDEHGLWLDQGEFERIIDSLQSEMLSKSLPEYISLSLAEAKEIITGEKGPIQEWKDFTTIYRLLEYRLLVDNPRLRGFLIGLGKSPL
jgi:Zn-finger nucleic acid-binding protein